MSISHQRLDKFLVVNTDLSKREIKLKLAQGKVLVDDHVVNDGSVIIHFFSQISLDGVSIQDNQPYYIMLHKPVGVVCATKDDKHITVIDLIRDNYGDEIANSLHIVGRLDLNTSGLVLLTNDSRWSSAVTSPENKIEKHYRVTLENPISTDYIAAFKQGMYFDYEGITTKPAKLSIVSSHVAHVMLTEGRYHQIKRMFGRFRNPVVGLHRYAVGNLVLADSLALGASRDLTKEEVALIF